MATLLSPDFAQANYGKPLRTQGYKYGSVRRGPGYKRPLPTDEARRLLGGHVMPIRRRTLPMVDAPHFIRGFKASDLEWRAWQAILVLGWPESRIEWQVDVLGGRMPGGRVLDIVVWTFSGPVVLAINGDYWHARGERQKQEEKNTEAMLQKIFGKRTRYYALYTADLLDDEIARRKIEWLIGRY